MKRNNPPVSIGILAADTGPDALKSVHGSFAQLFIRLFEQAGFTFDYRIYPVCQDEFPESPEVCDAWLITGSANDAYDTLPWIDALKRFVVELDKAKKPLVGICFGHQLIAEALGGRVEKFSGGWCLGNHEYQVSEPSAELFSLERFRINVIHQDQVVVKPARANWLASSDHCQFAALSYDDHILTMQGHPEFHHEYERDFLTEVPDLNFPEDLRHQALFSLNNPVDSDSLAKSLGNFLSCSLSR